MLRSLLISVILACFILIPCTVRALDVKDDIARATRTLNDIERLIDSIQSRNLQPRTVLAETVWRPLFDGKTLAGWKQTDFSGGAAVKVDPNFRGEGPAILVNAGERLSGLTWTGNVPKTNYEITLEALKIEGNDFLCGLTFPVSDSFATLILGGWGGTVVGISSIDNQDASENDTTKFITLEKDHWFKVRMKVTAAKLEAWLDDRKIVDQDIVGKKISLRFGEISKSCPLGLATYQTAAAYRNIRMRTPAGK